MPPPNGAGFYFGFGFYKYAAPDGAGERGLQPASMSTMVRRWKMAGLLSFGTMKRRKRRAPVASQRQFGLDEQGKGHFNLNSRKNMSAVNHHYNPQVYLKRFTNPKVKNELWEYDLMNGTVKKSTPKKSGFEKHFHSFLREDGVRDDDSIEKCFQKIENRLPELFEAIRNKQPITIQLWADLFVFAALLRARCPKQLHSLQESWSKVLTQVFELWKQTPEFDEKVRQDGFDPDKIQKLQVNMTADKDMILHGMLSSFGKGNLAKVFARMKWGFFCAPADKHFYSSDDPVCCWAKPDYRGPFGAVGPANEHIEITFPLTQKICAFGNWKSCPQDLYCTLPANAVDAINHRTVQNGYRFIYGPMNDSAILNFIKERLAWNSNSAC
jgi:hypothetical protein